MDIIGTKDVLIYLQLFSDDDFITGVLKNVIMRDKASLVSLETQALKNLLVVEEKASETDDQSPRKKAKEFLAERKPARVNTERLTSK